jgi:hypothetical protein
MKRNIYVKISLFLLIAGMIISSCIKDKDLRQNVPQTCSGTPTITGVSSTSTTFVTLDTLTQAKLGDWVIIHGKNLCSAKQVFFDDIEVMLADAFITSDAITLQIPREIPTTVTNKLKVVSDGGSSEASFKLTFPPLVVSGIANEYTPAGETMIILGANFDLYGATPEKGKVKFGDVEATIVRNSSDSIYVVVPQGITPGTTISVVADPATGAVTPAPYPYFDNRNLLFTSDFDYNGWSGADFITSGPPTPISGKFIRATTTLGTWGWIAFAENNFTTIPDDVVNNYQNYLIKFEVNTIKPYNMGVVRIEWDGNFTNSYVWPAPFDTKGQWRTVSIELSKLIVSPISVKASYMVNMVFHGLADPVDLDICFDNVRIVPKVQ